jgi:RNA recognition motif-containing protein
MNIYVGNLSTEVNQEDLQLTFEAFGQVSSAKVIMDKYIVEDPRGSVLLKCPLDQKHNPL